MDYHQLAPHIRQYIRQDLYEDSPENVRPFLVTMAEDQHKRNQHNITYITHEHSGDSGIYSHEEFPPFMNIVNHRFTLKKDVQEPDRGQFINIIRNYVYMLSTVPTHRMKNITMRYDISDGSVQWFSFSRRNIESMGFEKLLDHMVIGHDEWDEDFYGGSDYVRNYFLSRSLSFVQFFIIVELVQGGLGQVEYDYYKCIDFGNSDDTDCLINCFRYLSGIQMDTSKVRYLLGASYNEMLSLHHVAALEQMFKINVCIYEDRRAIGYSYRSGKHYYDYQAIIKKDYPIALYGDLNCSNKILWKNNHYSVIIEEYMARHCHCEHTGIFVGYGKKLMKEEIIKELHRQGRIDTDESTIGDDDKITYYYFFDYETVYDPVTMELMPYAWSLIEYDDEGNRMQIWEHVTSKLPARSILEVLLTEAPRTNERKYLIGFNNSRFDNYFLINECQRNNTYITNVFFAGNSILGMNIRGFIVRDLCRILCTSLEDACKSFKCNIGKGKLNHNEIQNCFFRGEAFNEDEVRKYVIRDCTSLAELYFKCQKEFKYLISIDIEKYNTIASMSYKSFKNVAELEHHEYPIVDTTQNEVIRESIYGGRSQIFQSCEIRNKEIESIDCVSLYPFVMINFPYPIGQPIMTDRYVKEKIGVYKCQIKKQPMRNIIPHRQANTPLDWAYDGSYACTLNSVDIDMIRKYGGEVGVIVGYYWDKQKKNIFEYYFRSIVAEKYKQDRYKETGDPRYNEALRECCKLLMNALSGKLQQRVFEEITELIRNNSDLDIFNKKVDNATETFTPFGDWFIAKGTKLNTRPKMPTIWGSLILSYARSYMYDNVLSKINCIFGTDTDSAFIYRSDIPKELIGTKLGQFKQEISKYVDEGESGPFGIFVAPKCYCFYKISKDGQEIAIKMRFKGVNINKDKLVDNPDTIIQMSTKELHDTYWNSTNAISINTFRQLLSDDIVVLCSSLEKRVTDSMMNTLKIRQRFALKKINKANIEGEILQII